jgi:ATP-dependent DNA helicase RecQ
VDDIQKQLGLTMRVINTGIYRPNLHYEVLRVTNDDLKKEHLIRLFQEIEGIGIVYCATVKAVHSLVALFEGSGVTVRGYHGKMKAAERKESQELFMGGALKAMIATNAFGMGIDKRDIRFVIHYQTPGSLEAYYQESGRAGRDGEMARCILLYQLDDRRTQVFFMSGRYPSADAVIAVYDTLKSLGATEKSVKLNEIEEVVSEVAEKKVRVILHQLKQMGIVKEARYARFKLMRDNLDLQEIRALSGQYETRAERDRIKLEQMMLYGQSPVCRWKLLHDYFEEPFPEGRCGHCDNCLHPLEEQIGQATQA